MQDHPNCEHCGGKLRHGKRWCSRECYDIARILSISSPNAHRKWAQHNIDAPHCAKCGATESDTGQKTALDRHHPDIRNRLVVVILCQRCHAQEHEHMRPSGRTCAVDGCEREHMAHGYCRNHSRLVKRYGVPWVVPSMRKPTGPPRLVNRETCPRGHRFTADNTYLRIRNGTERQECRACRALRESGSCADLNGVY